MQQWSVGWWLPVQAPSGVSWRDFLTASASEPSGSAGGAGAASASEPVGSTRGAEAEARAEARRWLREQLLKAVEEAWWPQAPTSEAVLPCRQGLYNISYRLRYGLDELDLTSTCGNLRVLASESGVKRWQVEYHLGHLIKEIAQCYVDRYSGLVVNGVLLPIQDGADREGSGQSEFRSGGSGSGCRRGSCG